MKILTLENKPLDLNTLPDQIEEDIRFSILDNSDSNNPDFFYVPLIFLESFTSAIYLICKLFKFSKFIKTHALGAAPTP